MNNKRNACGKKLNKLYVLDTISFEKMFATSADKSSDPYLWHRSICHTGINNLRKLKSDKLIKGRIFFIGELL